ncbi:MAG: hypothetical protein ACREV9_06915 [Burkholderiales bacterium]
MVSIESTVRRGELYDKLTRAIDAMTEEQIVDVFDNYDFVDWRGCPLAQSPAFRALVRMAKSKSKYVVTAP